MIPKFRAWDKTENKMWNVEAIYIEDEWVKVNDGSIYGTTKDLVRDYVLMQSTGLKDKNGVEIYEGDIVRYNRGISWSVEKFPYVVKNSMEGFVFEYGLIQHRLSKKIEYVTVIGNIYENPELLEDN